jgi:hypothetical protein
MKPVYLILDPQEPEVRVKVSRPINDVVLELFHAAPDIDIVEIATGLTNAPHARYQRGDAGVVTWSGRVVSREAPDFITRTDPVSGERRRVRVKKQVLMSPNAGDWVPLGVLEPSPEVIRDHEGLPIEWDEDLVGDDPDSKWSEWYAKQDERERYREAVGRLIQAGVISANDIYHTTLNR